MKQGSDRDGGRERERAAGASYAAAGVDTVGIDVGLGRLLRRIEASFSFPRIGRPALPNGYFANVLDVGSGIGIAIGTDGVGTKVLVAHAAGRYDTVGIDLVAMNVNDVICVGAEPIALVDYVAVPTAEPALLEQLAIGLVEGARRARVSIPGGEIAQVKELLRPHGPSGREGFDLVATAVGVVPIERVNVGRDVAPGDVVLGLSSNGIHSNGLTLARRVLADLDERPAELAGLSVAEEFLRPTRIYVREVMALLDAGVRVKALAHVTGDGLLNLLRVAARDVGFEIDALPPPPPIFSLIAARAGASRAEMYQTFNMGVGFCVVVAPADVERCLELLRTAAADPEEAAAQRAAGGPEGLAVDRPLTVQPIGRVVRDPDRRMILPGAGLVGAGKRFVPRA